MKSYWFRVSRVALPASMMLALQLLPVAAVQAQDAAVADPKHYKVEFENDQVRVLRITYGPHEKSVMHSHPAGVVVFLNDAKGKFTMPGGASQLRDMKAGTVAWSDPTIHQPENVGDTPFEVIQIELKSNPDETAIRAINPVWFEAYTAGDADRVAGLYAEDAVLSIPGVPPIRGRAAIRKAIAADISAMSSVGLSNYPGPGAEFGVSGDLGWEWSTFLVKDSSGATVDTGKYVTVYGRKDGKWMIIRDIWNSDAPPPAP